MLNRLLDNGRNREDGSPASGAAGGGSNPSGGADSADHGRDQQVRGKAKLTVVEPSDVLILRVRRSRITALRWRVNRREVVPLQVPSRRQPLPVI